MNSSLQILKNIYPLTKYILLENKIEEGIIIKEYTNLLYNLISKNNISTEASEFKEAISKYDDYFSGYEQKDCIICIISILSALNMDLKRKEIKNYEIINENDEEEIKFKETYNKIIKRKNSIIFDLFFGFLKLLYKCGNCNYKKVVFQCFNYLDLSVFDIDNNSKINNLEDCIKYYEKETISQFKCEKCGGEIIMKNIIYKLPKILIICFNRVYNNEHLNHLVEYPEYFNSNDYFSEKPKLLFPSNSKEENLYSLNGLIIHFGSANSGHKTSFCKNFFYDNWYYFNDSSRYSINIITKDVLNRKDAFLLVYQNSSIDIKLNDKKSIKYKCDNNCKNKFINKYISNYFIFNESLSIFNNKNENSFEKNDSNNSDDNLIQFNSEPNMDYKLHCNQNEKKSNITFFFLIFLIILVLIIIVIMKLCNVI
jgi:ubiquitin C-terminal hydrolase